MPGDGGLTGHRSNAPVSRLLSSGFPRTRQKEMAIKFDASQYARLVYWGAASIGSATSDGGPDQADDGQQGGESGRGLGLDGIGIDHGDGGGRQEFA